MLVEDLIFLEYETLNNQTNYDNKIIWNRNTNTLLYSNPDRYDR